MANTLRKANVADSGVIIIIRISQLLQVLSCLMSTLEPQPIQGGPKK